MCYVLCIMCYTLFIDYYCKLQLLFNYRFIRKSQCRLKGIYDHQLLYLLIQLIISDILNSKQSYNIFSMLIFLMQTRPNSSKVFNKVFQDGYPIVGFQVTVNKSKIFEFFYNFLFVIQYGLSQVKNSKVEIENSAKKQTSKMFNSKLQWDLDDQKEYKKQQESCQLNQKNELKAQNAQNVKSSLSPYKNQYFQYFSKNQISLQRITPFIQQLAAHKITFNRDKFSESAGIVKIFQSNYSKVVRLLVTLSYFKFEISLLNLTEESQSQDNLKVLGSGKEGIVFIAKQFQGDLFAIKEVNYYRPENIFKETAILQGQQKLAKLIQQYCIYKLCSVLKIGPYMRDYLGFDMLVYKNSIQFATQFCNKSSDYVIDQLKWSLGLLHSIKIIHGDIKMQNIMWSPKYNKLVFIDFGFSRCLTEDIGQMVRTTYFGTFIYSSMEMRQAFQSKKSNLVDLYYNDLFAIRRVFEQNRLFRVEKNYEDFDICQFYRNFLFNIKLQKCILDQDIERVTDICNHYRKQELFQESIDFFLEFGPSKKLQLICYFLKKFYTIETEKFNFVQAYFKRRWLFQSKIENNKNTQKRSFQQRITEKNLTSIGSLNILNDFLMEIFNQDIGVTAKIQKQKYLDEIKSQNFKPQKQGTWITFLNYIKNVYTSKEQILKIFDYVMPFIKIIGWPSSLHPAFRISARAFIIRMQVKNIYGIDLWQMYFKNDYKDPNYKQKIYQFYLQNCLTASQRQAQTIKKREPKHSKFQQRSTQQNSIEQKILKKFQVFNVAEYSIIGYQKHMQQYNLIQKNQKPIWQQIQKQIQTQTILSNYCFSPQYAIKCYHFHNIQYPLYKTQSNKGKMLSELIGNVREFLRLYEEMRSAKWMESDPFSIYAQFFNVATSVSCTTEFIKQVQEIIGVYVGNRKLEIGRNTQLSIYNLSEENKFMFQLQSYDQFVREYKGNFKYDKNERFLMDIIKFQLYNFRTETFGIKNVKQRYEKVSNFLVSNNLINSNFILLKFRFLMSSVSCAHLQLQQQQLKSKLKSQSQSQFQQKIVQQDKNFKQIFSAAQNIIFIQQQTSHYVYRQILHFLKTSIAIYQLRKHNYKRALVVFLFDMQSRLNLLEFQSFLNALVVFNTVQIYCKIQLIQAFKQARREKLFKSDFSNMDFTIFLLSMVEYFLKNLFLTNQQMYFSKALQVIKIICCMKKIQSFYMSRLLISVKILAYVLACKKIISTKLRRRCLIRFFRIHMDPDLKIYNDFELNQFLNKRIQSEHKQIAICALKKVKDKVDKYNANKREFVNVYQLLCLQKFLMHIHTIDNCSYFINNF